MLLFELFQLLENRINFLKKNLGPKIQAKIDADNTVDSETSDEFIDKVSNHDPSKKKLYTQWMITQYVKDLVKAEDIYKIEDDLKVFDQYKAKLPKKDINQYADYHELSDAISSLGDLEQHKSKKQKAKDVKHEGADKIYEDDTLSIVRLKTEEAACHYGKGTKWCTAATGGNNMFDHYAQEGPIYVIMNKKTGEKWQWHFESQQYMDEQDRHNPPGELMKRYPIIRKALSGPISKHLEKHPNDTAFMTQEQIGEYVTDLSKLKLVLFDGAIDMDTFVKKFPEKYKQLKPEIDAWNAERSNNGFFWTKEQKIENIKSVADVAKVAQTTYNGQSQNLRRSQFAYDLLMDVIDHIPVRAEEILSHLQRGGIMIPDIPEQLLDKSKPSDFTTDEMSITPAVAERYIKNWRNLTGRQVRILLRSIKDPRELPKDYLTDAPIHYMAEIYSEKDVVDATHKAGRRYDSTDAAEILAHATTNLDYKIKKVLLGIMIQSDLSDVVTDEFAMMHGPDQVTRLMKEYMMAKIMKKMDEKGADFDKEEMAQIGRAVEDMTKKYIKKTKLKNIFGDDYEQDEIAKFPDSLDDNDDVYDRIAVEHKPIGQITDEQMSYFLEETKYDMIHNYFTLDRYTGALKQIENITAHQWDMVFNALNTMKAKMQKGLERDDDAAMDDDYSWKYNNNMKPLIDKTDPSLSDKLLAKYSDLQKFFGDGQIPEPEPEPSQEEMDKLGSMLNKGFD